MIYNGALYSKDEDGTKHLLGRILKRNWTRDEMTEALLEEFSHKRPAYVKSDLVVEITEQNEVD